jgi:hypothetical protein
MQPRGHVFDAYASVRGVVQVARTASVSATLAGNGPFGSSGGQTFRGPLTAEVET